MYLLARVIEENTIAGKVKRILISPPSPICFLAADNNYKVNIYILLLLRVINDKIIFNNHIYIIVNYYI